MRAVTCLTLAICFAVQAAADRLDLDQVHVSLGHYTAGTWSAVVSFAGSPEVSVDTYGAAVNVSSVAESDLFTHVSSCIMFYGDGKTYTYEVDDNLVVSKVADRRPYRSPPVFHTEVTGLPSDADVFYMIGLRDKAQQRTVHVRNESFHFRTPPAPGANPTTGTMVFSVIGDIGQTVYSEHTRNSIVAQLEASRTGPDVASPSSSSSSVAPSFAMIVGDISYADGNASRWDRWGRLMEPLFSRLPLMVLPGNHEIEIDNRTKQAFVHYRHRFRMPEALSEVVEPARDYGKKNWDEYSVNLKYDGGSSFYSFNAGYCHVIALNVYDTHAVLDGVENVQEKFLREDLEAVNRSQTPFVLVFLHSPLYNTNGAHHNEVAPKLFKAWAEPLFLEHAVDVVSSGHVHAYERSLGIANGRYEHSAPIYITLGDGGNRELLYNEWDTPSLHNVFRDGRRYGHGEFRAYNETHLEWVWKPNPAQEGSVEEDRTWIRPLALRQVPASVLPPAISVLVVVIIGSIGLCFSWLACKSYSKDYEYSESLLLDKTKLNGESSSSLSLELT